MRFDTRSLEDNFRFLSTLAAPHAELLAIVKADAYGHSLSVCAPAVARAGARWLGVTSVEEGVATRALCPEAQILVIGGVFPGQGTDVVRAQADRRGLGAVAVGRAGRRCAERRAFEPVRSRCIWRSTPA